MNNPSNKSDAVPLLHQPTPKTPYLPNDRINIRRLGQIDHNNITGYVFHDVIEELFFASEFRTAQITGGILTGGFYEGPAGAYVEIRGFKDYILIEDTTEFLKYLDSNWETLIKDEGLAVAGLRPVGWYLSKPDSGAELGAFEFIIQMSYFNLPYSHFVLLDPIQKKMGMYSFNEDNLMRNVGFNLIEVTSPNTE
jgi:hypothetical protein